MSDNSKDEAASSSTALSKCLLSQYIYTCAGLGFATAYSLKSKRGYAPLIIGGLAGTATDFLYGYFIGCAKEVERYKADERSEQ
mmetsp:Transcript_19581/g.25359  ORF Transcript_19581/g.25359 Transcript_19581/m.25359 type:complete len:84 (-) Transcript_19581:278-529(-)